MSHQSYIEPNTFIALRLPSGFHKVVQIVPNNTISLGKFGSFFSNSILYRPYHVTFEIQDKKDHTPELRIIPASELHAENLLSETEPSPSESRGDDETSAIAEDLHDGGDHRDIKEAAAAKLQKLPEDQFKAAVNETLLKDNRLTNDDPSKQTLSLDEIETLKQDSSSASGRAIVAKIMASHSAINEKTTFSLAKYFMRKTRKYMKRFTPLALDVTTLAHYLLHDKGDAPKIMELREETLGLISSWSNVHYSLKASLPMNEALKLPHDGADEDDNDQDTPVNCQSGRWLVVDDTAGLLVALMAERMGILHHPSFDDDIHIEDEATAEQQGDSRNTDSVNHDVEEVPLTSKPQPSPQHSRHHQKSLGSERSAHPPPALSNTITLLHSSYQPNLSVLTYFGYDANNPSTKQTQSQHPLNTHLKTLSFLQLLSPDLSSAYHSPDSPTNEPNEASQSPTKNPANKRSAHNRKLKRHARIASMIDETRAGGFDGLVISSTMHPTNLLHHLVPLLKGGAPVCVFSPHVEPLAELLDSYSAARKAAILAERNGVGAEDADSIPEVPSSLYPLNPTLLLAPSLQTLRDKQWQCLPGRTHPLMTGKGGGDGYLFTGVRVIPYCEESHEGRVEGGGRLKARGAFSWKKKEQKEPRFGD
ncbi:MAG: tRNA (adenine(58)-N(1))-methyltransferase non-catalytic subunit trm6 [Alyxoria varia]|nr:MAG: tRNA (adenine(58)-N(1))-methyltransferase non-catalytic subunit trm6 [Alyxoria varia]